MSGLLQNIGLIGENDSLLKGLRQDGRDAFLSSGIPTPKTEAWKYTKPNRFFADDYIYNPRGGKSLSVTAKKLPFDNYPIYFENGILQEIAEDLPEGIEVLPLVEALACKIPPRQKIGALLPDLKQYPFAALNTAYLNEGVYIHAAKEIKLDKSLAIINHITPQTEKMQYNLRNLIVVDEGAEIELVEYYHYTGEEKSSYLLNAVNEIYVSRNATLKQYKYQNEAYKSGHIALNAVKVLSDGLYKSFCLQKGADLARQETKVVLAEEGAEAIVDAAYVMNGWATIDTTTNIEHLKPNTHSSQLVKGVVGGQAKGVFQGKIHIAPDAVKTEGYQLHKAMLLSNEAEIDVKPELEIFADDVKCSHGSACGQLDKEQLFYMRSRGIDAKEAEQLLIDAYLNDVIAKVDNEKIRDWIKLSVKAK